MFKLINSQKKQNDEMHMKISKININLSDPINAEDT